VYTDARTLTMMLLYFERGDGTRGTEGRQCMEIARYPRYEMHARNVNDRRVERVLGESCCRVLCAVYLGCVGCMGLWNRLCDPGGVLVHAYYVDTV
jgi:hypothetical protein